MKTFTEWLKERDRTLFEQITTEGLRSWIAAAPLALSALGGMAQPATADVTKSVTFQQADDQSLVPFEIKINNTGDDLKNAQLVLADIAKETGGKTDEISTRAMDWARRNTSFSVIATADKKTPLVPQAMTSLLKTPELLAKNAKAPAVQTFVKNTKAILKDNGDGTLSTTIYLKIGAVEHLGGGKTQEIRPGRITGDEDAGGTRIK